MIMIISNNNKNNDYKVYDMIIFKIALEKEPCHCFRI